MAPLNLETADVILKSSNGSVGVVSRLHTELPTGAKLVLNISGTQLVPVILSAGVNQPERQPDHLPAYMNV